MIEIQSTVYLYTKGNWSVTDGFLAQRPETRSIDVFFDLRLNKRLSEPSRRQWFVSRQSLLWCHNGRDGVSNHQPHNSLHNRSFRRRLKKKPSKLRVTGLCDGNSPVTGWTLIPAWICNHTPSEVWNEIAYPLPNFNGAAVEICELISNLSHT